MEGKGRTVNKYEVGEILQDENCKQNEGGEWSIPYITVGIEFWLNL